MSKSKISTHILEMIRDRAADDKEMRSFLLEILYDEAENVGKQWWHFKEKYKRMIDNYSRTWSGNDKDNENST